MNSIILLPTSVADFGSQKLKMHHLQFFTFHLSWWIPGRGKPQNYTFTLLISRFLISSFHPPQWTMGCRKTFFTLEFFGSFSASTFHRRISRCEKTNIVPCFHFSFLISSFRLPQENSKVRTHLIQMHSNSITRLLTSKNLRKMHWKPKRICKCKMQGHLTTVNST